MINVKAKKPKQLIRLSHVDYHMFPYFVIKETSDFVTYMKGGDTFREAKVAQAYSWHKSVKDAQKFGIDLETQKIQDLQKELNKHIGLRGALQVLYEGTVKRMGDGN